MNVRPGLISWFGLYKTGACGIALGCRAHWWFDLVIPPRTVSVLRMLMWLAAIVVGGMVLYGELLGWHDQYEGLLNYWRHLRWLENPV